MKDQRQADIVAATYPANAGYTSRAELEGSMWRIVRMATSVVGAGADAKDPISRQEMLIKDPAYWLARSKAISQ